MNEQNYLKQLGWLVLIVVSVLSALYFLPSMTLDNHAMRRVDLLSDVRPKVEQVQAVDSSLLAPKVKPAFKEVCPPGKTCIVDYSDSTARGMQHFYASLEPETLRQRPVRIAYFGDSFIEGDILTSDLRHMLQQKYGGCGVGFVPVTSITAGFRPTVHHSFQGWGSHSIVDTIYFDRSKQGISGHYFVPSPGATVELRGQNKYCSLLDTCDRASIYLLAKKGATLNARINRGASRTFAVAPSGRLQKIEVDGRIGQVRWTVSEADSALFYGMALDGDHGIQLDNFSLRGTSGLNLRSVPVRMMKAFNGQRPYDLIILQYGLNVANKNSTRFDSYMEGMHAAIESLKQSFPQASILVVSVGDRDYRTETGELRSMPGIKNLVLQQQNLAAEEHVAFWNMWEAMGGETGMARLVHAKPSMANYDYTHINFRGGKYLAGLLFEALNYGKEQFEKRRAYEAE